MDATRWSGPVRTSGLDTETEAETVSIRLLWRWFSWGKCECECEERRVTNLGVRGWRAPNEEGLRRDEDAEAVAMALCVTSLLQSQNSWSFCRSRDATSEGNRVGSLRGIKYWVLVMPRGQSIFALSWRIRGFSFFFLIFFYLSRLIGWAVDI